MKYILSTCAAVLSLALPTLAQAQPAAPESKQQAREILMRMASYLGFLM